MYLSFSLFHFINMSIVNVFLNELKKKRKNQCHQVFVSMIIVYLFCYLQQVVVCDNHLAVVAFTRFKALKL